MILEMVKRQIPELDWQVVHRLEDLPEGAPALEAAQVLRGSWQQEGDDPQLRQVRWYRREQHSLVFTPTNAQFKEWDAARDRARDARAALIERHRDQLPVFGGRSLDDWDEYYTQLKGQEDEIAKDFDTEREAATHQFYRGDYRWLATLNAAISGLGIPENEVEVLRSRTQARIAEAEAALRIQ
jgi:superfamily II DNA or RNA helicase